MVACHIDMWRRESHNMNTKPTVSKEMYLKTIYCLSQKEGSARSVDIAEFLNVSRPSVSVAMKGLVLDDLIEKDMKHHIVLTPEGQRQALSIIEKYNILLFFLAEILEVDIMQAKTDADKMEHVVSNETISRIKKCCELNIK